MVMIDQAFIRKKYGFSQKNSRDGNEKARTIKYIST